MRPIKGSLRAFMEWPNGLQTSLNASKKQPNGLQTSLNASVNQSGALDKSSPVGFYEIVKGFQYKKIAGFMEWPNGL